MAQPASTSTGFVLIEQLLAERPAGAPAGIGPGQALRAGVPGKATCTDQWLTQPLQKLDAIRAANTNAKVKKECDAVELGLRRTLELIHLLRSGQVKP